MKPSELKSVWWTDALGRNRLQQPCPTVKYKRFAINVLKRRSIWETNLPERDIYELFLVEGDTVQQYSLAFFDYETAVADGKKWIEAILKRNT